MPRMSWHKKVDRLVLLAGMNKGWKRPDNLLTDLVLGAVGITGQGALSRATERGSPFVGDLRIEWLRESRRLDVSDLPPVVQIVGGDEDILKIDDDKDLVVSGNNIFLSVPASDHYTITDLSPETMPKAQWLRDAFDNFFRPNRWKASAETYRNRKRIFRDALTASYEELVSIEDRTRRLVITPDYSVERVVFVAHGIRDYGGWTQDYITDIEQRDPAYRGEKFSYERFPMVSFILGNRKKNVKPFVDEYVDRIAEYPNARFSFIGHSNGTYILASTLKNYKAAEFDYIYFAGSVVRRSYQWSDLIQEGRVQAVRNDIAKGDWIVAFFPGLFEKFRTIALLEWVGRDSLLGNAGYADFLSASVAGNGYSFKGGHGAALESQPNRRSAIDFALLGEPSLRDYENLKVLLDGDGLLSNSPDEPIGTLANYPWVVWLVIIVVLGVAWQLTNYLVRMRMESTPFWVHVLYVLGVYVIANSF